MEEKRAIVISHGSFSHIVSNALVVDCLSKNDVLTRVLSNPLGGEFCSDLGLDFKVCNSVPFAKNFEYKITRDIKRSYHYNLKLRYNNSLYNERREELLRCLNEFQPSYLFIDCVLATDFLILYDYIIEKGISVKFISTMPSLCRQINSVPISSKICLSMSFSVI